MTEAKVLLGATREQLIEALHREDLLGRAIHEDAWSMQVPTFPATECGACEGHADRLLAALAEMQPKPQLTFCRKVHHTMDDCPEHCPRCRGYFHGDTDCRTADATDAGGPMPGWKDKPARPCGSCLTAEFADEDSEDDETLFVPPGKDTGHLRRPKGSETRGIYGMLGRGAEPYTYCGRAIGDDWQKVAR